MENCTHSELFDGLCVFCGKDLSHEENKDYDCNSDIQIRGEERDVMKKNLSQFLLENKKLALVIDLDKTLIDTCCPMSEQEANAIIKEDPEHENDFFYFKQGNYIYLVRIRPYAREFLQNISKDFHLYLDTLSQRSYAEAILEKLDPNRLFGDRIRCRNERKLDTKNINSFILDDRYTIALDDTPDVWITEKKYKRENDRSTQIYHNLIQLVPFTFFVKKDMSYHVSERGINDNQLIKIQNVLSEIHDHFYEFEQTDVIVTINDLKKNILKGCYILFTNISDREDVVARLYKKAEDFGANVLFSHTPYITHVVTCGLSEELYKEVSNYKGVYIVNPGWIDYSCFRFEKEDEYNYPVANLPVITVGEKQIAEPPNEDIDSSDIDEFIGEEEDANDNAADNDSADSEDISFLE